MNKEIHRLKKKRKISSRILWIICLLSTIVFSFTFYNLPMFPKRWIFMGISLTFLMLIFLLIITCKLKPYNIISKSLNLLFALSLLITSIALPYVTDKVAAIFDHVVANTVRINVYVLKDSYKQEHALKQTDFKQTTAFKDWQKARFGGLSYLDKENQDYGFTSLNKQLKTNVERVNYATIDKSIRALYDGDIDALVMSEPYVQLLSESAENAHFKDDTYIVASYIHELAAIKTSKTNVVNQPFALFVAGNDQPGSLSLFGRTDVDMIMVINPKQQQVLMLNLPRDSYVSNPAYADKKDKLTHLGMSGLNVTMKSLSKLLDINIDHYALVNFTTFMQIITVLKGVDIENPYAFKALDGRFFKKGMIHLDADEALMYVRERKSLKNGDFDRNMHQQLVMKAIIKKLTSLHGILHFNNLLDTLKNSFLTNLKVQDIYALMAKQLDKGGNWDIINYHLTGESVLRKTASFPQQKLAVVLLDKKQLSFIKDELQKIFNGDRIEQEQLSD